MRSPSILPAQKAVASCAFWLFKSLCYISGLPSAPYALVRRVSGKFFRTLANRVTCLSVFCRQYDMPKVHLVALSSIISPFLVPSSTECSWFAYLMFLPGHLFGDDMELQCYVVPQAL